MQPGIGLRRGIQEEAPMLSGLLSFVPDSLVSAAGLADSRLGGISERNGDNLLGDAANALSGNGAISALATGPAAALVDMLDRLFGSDGGCHNIGE